MSHTTGGQDRRARDQSGGQSPARHIICCICLEPISPDEYNTARCWTDPHGITCAAHAACLIRVGEKEIGLR